MVFPREVITFFKSIQMCSWAACSKCPAWARGLEKMTFRPALPSLPVCDSLNLWCLYYVKGFWIIVLIVWWLLNIIQKKKLKSCLKVYYLISVKVKFRIGLLKQRVFNIKLNMILRLYLVSEDMIFKSKWNEYVHV